MKVIDPHRCSCESLMDLTYADTFKNLDERFVRAIGRLLNANYVRLCLGDYKRDQEVVLATYQVGVGARSDRNINLNTKVLPEPSVIFPIHLSTGQQISLLLATDPSEREISEITQLMAVYVNQHGHLTRSNKDQLTGLKNRRSFDLEYSSLTNNARPEDSNVIAVLDIDHFKRVNDEFGHIIGDETLIAVANLMKRFFLRDDYLYRFGGEEFIILFHDMNEVQAAEILDKLRIEVSKQYFPQVEHITVSIGFVQLTNLCDSVILFERADAALYQAKDSGRNCIKGYQTLVDEGVIEPIDKRSGDVELF